MSGEGNEQETVLRVQHLDQAKEGSDTILDGVLLYSLSSEGGGLPSVGFRTKKLVELVRIHDTC